MAHFAELDVFCNVVRVIVVNDDDLKDSDNIEKEKIGQKFAGFSFLSGLGCEICSTFVKIVYISFKIRRNGT